MTQPPVSDRPEVVNVPGPAYRNRLTGNVETVPTAASIALSTATADSAIRAVDGTASEGDDDAAS